MDDLTGRAASRGWKAPNERLAYEQGYQDALDAANARADEWERRANRQLERAVAAEAKVQRLTEALRKIDAAATYQPQVAGQIQGIARAALSGDQS